MNVIFFYTVYAVLTPISNRTCTSTAWFSCYTTGLPMWSVIFLTRLLFGLLWYIPFEVWQSSHRQAYWRGWYLSQSLSFLTSFSSYNGIITLCKTFLPWPHSRHGEHYSVIPSPQSVKRSALCSVHKFFICSPAFSIPVRQFIFRPAFL